MFTLQLRKTTDEVIIKDKDYASELTDGDDDTVDQPLDHKILSFSNPAFANESILNHEFL